MSILRSITPLLLCICLVPAYSMSCRSLTAEEQSLPNILWLTSEDNGPHLGCYGDTFATSPHIDSIAEKGVVYLNCWSNAPVCAPARTTIISGLYPPSTGAEHMRSMTRLPSEFNMYPVYLKQAGYYCTNNSKEDYNLEKVGPVWDESSRKAHWKNRKEGQPFFAIFNYTTSHESQIRKRPHKAIHNPMKVRVPAYHPDRPEVRQDWAQYYDKITEMDQQIGQRLQELNDAGLAEETIIFYYGDHGSGMPRSKRWPYNSGLHVPLVVHIPDKFKHLQTNDYLPGGKTDRLVSFVDLAPTLLSLAGMKPPQHFQGHAFLGKYATKPQPYIYGFRGRMDERYDLVRSVRNQRYVYIRHYMPHKIYGQFIAYMFQTPTTKVWKELYDAGKLNELQSQFWQPKPAEALYDLKSDPDEVHNLANSKDHQQILEEFRTAQRNLALKIRDVGFLPEGEIHSRSKDRSPYEMGHDPQSYPMETILKTAELASSGKPNDLTPLLQKASDSDSAVRYWVAMGLLMRGEKGVTQGHKRLVEFLSDSSPSVRVIAAEALGKYGTETDSRKATDILLDLADVTKHGVYTAMLANNALDAMDERAKSAKGKIVKLPRKDSSVPRRMGAYIGNLINKTLSDLK